MKKKISLLLCVLIAVLSFVGCSGKGNEGVNAEQKEEIKTVSEFMFGLFSTEGSDAYFEEWLSLSDYELNYELMAMSYTYEQYGVPSWHVESDDFRNMIKAWQGAIEECGAYVSCGDFVVGEDGMSVSANVQFKNKSAEVVFGFDEKQNMESLDIAAKQSMSEILTKAGLNTLLGMGTVFAVLILLAFIIYLMQYIPKLFELQSANDNNTDAKTVTTERVVETPQTVEVEQVVECADDLELVAVITAAIAAQTGTSADGFVVRSIKRRPSNKWN